MIWSACNSRHSNIENAYIPSEPDYTDEICNRCSVIFFPFPRKLKYA